MATGALAKTLTALNPGKEDFWVKHDGSLNNGIEVVFAPRTIKNWNRFGIERVKTIIDTIIDHEPVANSSDKCGLHIHLSRRAFKKSEIANMIDFLDANWKKIVMLLSRRKGDRWLRYATNIMENVNALCEATKKTGLSTEEKLQYAIAMKKINRYTNVNILNPNTIELRFFQGSLNPSIILSCIQFAAILKYVAEDNAHYDFNAIYKLANQLKYNELATFLAAKEMAYEW